MPLSHALCGVALDQQEEKYATELDAALAQYIELQQQTADMDAMELDMACQIIRPDDVSGDQETSSLVFAA